MTAPVVSKQGVIWIVIILISVATLVSMVRVNQTLIDTSIRRRTSAVSSSYMPSNDDRLEPPPISFDCSQLGNLTIVRALGMGKNKIAFEVVLPSGIHVAAKRCNTNKCIKHNEILQEANFFRLLQEQYPNESVKFYGDCSLEANKTQKVQDMVGDFEWGPTHFIELATPVMPTWKWKGKRRRRTKPRWDEWQDLRLIARQYDGFSNGRIKLQGDNRYAHQYVRTEAGLRHIDFDTVAVLPRSSESLLEYNCQVLLGKFAGLKKDDPRLNCTEAYSRQVEIERLANAK